MVTTHRGAMQAAVVQAQRWVSSVAAARVRTLSQQTTPVLICGGGPTGLVTALSLGRWVPVCLSLAASWCAWRGRVCGWP